MKKLFILIALLFYFSIILLFASPIQAQEDQYDIYLPVIMKEYKSPLEKYQEALQKCATGGTTSLECWIGGPEQVAEEPETAATGVMPAITNSLTTMIIGPLPTPALPGQQIQYRPGGAIGGITNLIAVMYANPPASSVEYFADLGRNLGIFAKPAYAQAGIGFKGLTPILPLWKAFRNIAYLFFTIVFVIIGFAIMFRVKLDPQTVISIQNAIPRIVVALILVTFSYAIVGLLIDLMYVFLLLGIALMGWTNLIPATVISELQTQFLTGGFPQLIGAVFKATPEGVWLTFAAIGGAVGGAIGAIAGAQPLIIVGGVIAGALLLDLLIAVILLYVLFKLLIELIKAYISIILALIFAPLQIMIGVLPGSQMGFGSWLRNLLANLAIFPAVAIFVLIARALTSHIETSGLWTPPMMIGGLGITAAGLIGFGMLLLLSKVPQMVKEALQIKPFPYGAAIGEALGPARAIGKAGYLYGAGETARFLEISGPKTWRETAAGVIRTVTGVRRGG